MPNRYSTQFKMDAVRLVVMEGYSHKRAAEAVGVAHTTILDWVHKYRDKFPARENFESERDELEHLRAENRRLTMERDILKKAAAFFAKEEGA